MSSALSKKKYKPVIENYFNKIAKQDNLTSLNTAFSKEGAYIHIPKNTEVEKPIQIINFTTGEESCYNATTKKSNCCRSKCACSNY